MMRGREAAQERKGKGTEFGPGGAAGVKARGPLTLGVDWRRRRIGGAELLGETASVEDDGQQIGRRQKMVGVTGLWWHGGSGRRERDNWGCFGLREQTMVATEFNEGFADSKEKNESKARAEDQRSCTLLQRK